MKKANYQYCLFKKGTIKGIYNKTKNFRDFPISFLKFEIPREPYLLNAGAAYVLQSWKMIGSIRKKILHTGLIP